MPALAATRRLFVGSPAIRLLSAGAGASAVSLAVTDRDVPGAHPMDRHSRRGCGGALADRAGSRSRPCARVSDLAGAFSYLSRTCLRLRGRRGARVRRKLEDRALDGGARGPRRDYGGFRDRARETTADREGDRRLGARDRGAWGDRAVPFLHVRPRRARGRHMEISSRRATTRASRRASRARRCWPASASSPPESPPAGTPISALDYGSRPRLASPCFASPPFRAPSSDSC